MLNTLLAKRAVSGSLRPLLGGHHFYATNTTTRCGFTTLSQTARSFESSMAQSSLSSNANSSTSSVDQQGRPFGVRPRAPACDGIVCKVSPTVTDAIEGLADEKRAQLRRIKSEFGNIVLGHNTVSTALGGMRGSTPLLVCETSQLDPQRGITIRGHHIQDLVDRLPSCFECADPRSSMKKPPLSEGLLWLLLTGSLPDLSDVRSLSRELRSRMTLPDHVYKAVGSLPTDMHPMTQFIIGIAACQSDSLFAERYKAGIRKDDYWKPTLEDGLSLVAKLPALAALVYRRTYKDGRIIEADPDLDWAANIAHMMGVDDLEAHDMMRLYMYLHADHEGGNVSAHSAHLVGSALSDVFLAFGAAMSGLAGPLHGLANQETLRYLVEMLAYIKENNKPLDKAVVEERVKATLAEGRVIPGFGHAVLRAIDPRFVVQKAFAETRMGGDDLFKLLNLCLEVVPPILEATGKVSNPHPNIDFHSGVILQYYGIKEAEFFTVLFGVSRAQGIVSQLVWDRIFGLPIERPKSITLDSLERMAMSASQSTTA